VELALAGGGEVVNFDSVQIYREIEIATAKPTDEDKRGVPHHLIDYVDPRVDYSAGDWARDAEQKIAEIESRGKTAILVGGTGFYLRTLRQPLFEGPKTDPELRERFRSILAAKGPEHLHRMLARFDPAAAGALPQRDFARVVRALEVYFQTGTRISEQQPNRAPAPELASRLRLFVLNPPRDVLYEKINARTEQHFANGLVEEVTRLRASGIPDTSNALGAHAYRRVCEYLRGERSLDEAIDQSKRDVRHYAKRQITWFRREPVETWFDGFGTEERIACELLAKAEQIANN
jgi:tRNA dimethylallyltransferase